MDRASAQRLFDALQIRPGIVCAVGAGGKKSTLRRLFEAAALLDFGPAASTATVMVAPFSDDEGWPVVVAAPRELAERLQTLMADGVRKLAYVCPSGKPSRHAGVPAALVRELHDAHGFELTLVKADGARMRLVKAPNEDEPVLPPSPDMILPIVSVQAVGRTLDERIAHRVNRLVEVTGRAIGEPILPEDLAALLAHRHGGLQGAGTAAVVPIVNAVDDPGALRLARRIAALALEQTDRFARVVLTTMNRPDPVIEVIEHN